MKERTPLCHCRVQRRDVCLHIGSQGVLFGATEPAQDPSSRADDVLRWVGRGGPRHSLALGPRCFLSACWKSKDLPMMSQINHVPAPAMPCGSSKSALNIQLFLFFSVYFSPFPPLPLSAVLLDSCNKRDEFVTSIC